MLTKNAKNVSSRSRQSPVAPAAPAHQTSDGLQSQPTDSALKARASAANTINCGCTALPFMEDWEVANPGAVPFTNDELFNNPLRRNLQQNIPRKKTKNVRAALRRGGPGIERVLAYASLPRDAAARLIAQGLRGDEFKRFVAEAGKSNDAWPVAVLPDDITEALQTEARIVRLSSYTAAKQKVSRKGQSFKTSDYQRVQELVDQGSVVQDSDNSVIVIYDDMYLATKTTKDRRETYLQTLHRTSPEQEKRKQRKWKIIRS